MAARWAAGEEILTACNMDLFHVDSLDEVRDVFVCFIPRCVGSFWCVCESRAAYVVYTAHGKVTRGCSCGTTNPTSSQTAYCFVQATAR